MLRTLTFSRLAQRCLAPLLVALLLPVAAMSQVSVEISANVAPPELPVYDQPPIPSDGYLWAPGYWAWSDDIQDYYWVPGTWVIAPQPNYLWTPGYWAVDAAVFLFHPGYWGPHVGFYGGVNYGYGYGGNGYEGGYWQGGHLYYNRSVNNISNVNITNVYNKTVINNVTVNRVSYNGGNGIHAQATPAQLAAAHEHHLAATPVQQQHVEMARNQPGLRASQNQGHPSIGATSRPTAFTGAGVVGTRQAGAAGVPHPHAATPSPHAGAPVHNEYEQRPGTSQSHPEAQHPQYEQRSAPPPPAPRPTAPPPPPRPAPPPEGHAPSESHAPPPPHPAEHPAEHERDH